MVPLLLVVSCQSPRCIRHHCGLQWRGRHPGHQGVAHPEDGRKEPRYQGQEAREGESPGTGANKGNYSRGQCSVAVSELVTEAWVACISRPESRTILYVTDCSKRHTPARVEVCCWSCSKGLCLVQKHLSFAKQGLKSCWMKLVLAEAES